MTPGLVARVAVEGCAYHFDKTYDYLITPDKQERVQTGSRVLVPFGTGNRKRQGVVLDILPSTELAKLKPIHSVLDEKPIVTEEMRKLAAFLKERTFCTLFDAIKVQLPVGINHRQVVLLFTAGDADETTLQSLDATGREIFDLVAGNPDGIAQDKVIKLLGLDPHDGHVDHLVKKGLLRRDNEAVRNVRDATQKMARLCELGAQEIKLTSKQQSVVELLTEAGAASVKEIGYFTGVTSAVVKALETKGVVELYDAEVLRTPYRDIETSNEIDSLKLSPEQEKAYEKLFASYKHGEYGVNLLYGVTGSGKTSVFLKLIDQVVADGKGVIVLVPEISLTPQMVDKFHMMFGRKVSVLHSGLSLGERMDEWKRIKRGDAAIAVGTRSAVFAPFDKLGLIIIDEEQEHTYKSESSPRYHAREVAQFRCHYHKAPLVLSSATPSLESFYHAKNGDYSLVTLKKRYNDVPLPPVVTVDMKEEYKDGVTGCLSRLLIDELSRNLAEGKQSILLLNRRGYNTFISCRDCGHVITCPNCSIAMTYHSANNRLLCHYCGMSVPLCTTCPECGGGNVRYSGTGTQLIEQQLASYFPQARVLRMDMDTTMARFAHERKFKEFAGHQYDIMIGTQMVAKGLNFHDVTLVGILSADQTLYADDFRSYERTFSLLTQVIGRSGRGESRGRAVIQTQTPENSVIALAATQDYDRFYGMEIEARRLMLYPPFCDLCVVGFTGPFEDQVQKGALLFFEWLKELAGREFADVPLKVIGPCAASVPKISGKHRYKLIVKCKANARLRRMMAVLLSRFSKDKSTKQVNAFIDINPQSIL